MSEHKSVPEWAIDRVQVLSAPFSDDPDFEINERFPTVRAFARYIASVEEAPVDPLLIEAREICSREMGVDYSKETTFSRGALAATYAALRRGIEIGGAK